MPIESINRIIDDYRRWLGGESDPKEKASMEAALAFWENERTYETDKTDRA